MQIPGLFRNRRRVLFWGTLVSILILGIAAFGAAFQNDKSNTILSVPTLWMFGLIALPILLYLIVAFYWNKHDRFSR